MKFGWRRLEAPVCNGVERGYNCKGRTNSALLCAAPNHFGGWEDGTIANYRAAKNAPADVSGVYQNGADLIGISHKPSKSTIRPYYKCCIPLRREVGP